MIAMTWATAVPLDYTVNGCEQARGTWRSGAMILLRAKYEKPLRCIDTGFPTGCTTFSGSVVWAIVHTHKHAHTLRLCLAFKEETVLRLAQRAAENPGEEICTAVPVSHVHTKRSQASQIQTRYADPRLAVSLLPTNKLMESLAVLRCPISDNQVPSVALNQRQAIPGDCS